VRYGVYLGIRPIWSDIGVLNQIDGVVFHEKFHSCEKVSGEDPVGNFNLLCVGVIVPLHFEFAHVKRSDLLVIPDGR